MEPDAVSAWILRPDVRKALHLEEDAPGASAFSYAKSGPAAITLYPDLVKRLRILIFSGDLDSRVPYLDTFELPQQLEAMGALRETARWGPWFSESMPGPRVPAGYAVGYGVPGSAQQFIFATVHLAGHAVPAFQPEAAFTMFSRFLKGTFLSIDRVDTTGDRSAGLLAVQFPAFLAAAVVLIVVFMAPASLRIPSLRRTLRRHLRRPRFRLLWRQLSLWISNMTSQEASFDV